MPVSGRLGDSARVRVRSVWKGLETASVPNRVCWGPIFSGCGMRDVPNHVWRDQSPATPPTAAEPEQAVVSKPPLLVRPLATPQDFAARSVELA